MLAVDDWVGVVVVSVVVGVLVIDDWVCVVVVSVVVVVLRLITG